MINDCAYHLLLTLMNDLYRPSSLYRYLMRSLYRFGSNSAAPRGVEKSLQFKAVGPSAHYSCSTSTFKSIIRPISISSPIASIKSLPPLALQVFCYGVLTKLPKLSRAALKQFTESFQNILLRCHRDQLHLQYDNFTKADSWDSKRQELRTVIQW
jgi:hypothetical protein